ncbi:ROK family transcriptional regulator [Athalassotoga saccharophila]|uniref:ROK family transcriptional regulator n=1 Tax=Athalassotoga saccharophila TaxID=1441386 RepID=UPI0013797067|nr:ROK family transcriptional regulator [Athalassotoga saccharophila]BBJ27300.1 xylose-responsive transcription regulator, ROK family [Athalassotoga saccharophila]
MEIRTMNSESMGRSNRLAILDLIRKYPGISRRDLVEMTGLNPSTVTNIVFDLMENGFVEEGGKNASNKPGKRRVNLLPSKNAASAILIKIGVENTQIGLGYLNNDFERVDEFSTPSCVDTFLKETGRRVEKILKNSGEKIKGISISVPGIVDKNEISMKILPHLGWKDIKMKEEMERILGEIKIPIYLENEAKLSLMAEMYFNDAIQKMVNGVYIYISQGVGGALLINGEIFLGTSFTAGEVGHMSINADGPTCHCGNNGCWEEYISIDTIVQKYNSQKQLKGSNFKAQFEDLISRSEHDRLADEVLNEMMYYLSIGIVNIVNILNPQFVMIGGMGEKIPKRYIQIVRNEVSKKALGSATKDLLILTSSMDMIQSALMGCTLMAMNEFSKGAFL